MFNARRLADRTRLRVLLVGGLVGGIIALLTLPITVAVRSAVVMWIGYPVGGLIGCAVDDPVPGGGTGQPTVERLLRAAPAAPPRRLVTTG